jgi:hypothetical protein
MKGLKVLISVFIIAAMLSLSAATCASAEETGVTGKGVYTIDNVTFGIYSDGTHSRSTTDGINAALLWAGQNGYTDIRLTDGNYLITSSQLTDRYNCPDDGILIPSGIHLDLGNAVLRMEANSSRFYNIIAFPQVSNASVTGGMLIGDRYEHNYAGGSSHEFGFGITVYASENIGIDGVTICKTTGDGIVIRGNTIKLRDGGAVSSHVLVQNCEIFDCRRNGIGVTGVKDSLITNNSIFDISGTDPQYGIDIEAESDYTAENLRVCYNTIYDCATGAICCQNGGGYYVYANTCIDNNILSVSSTNVQIFDNVIQGNICIRVYEASDNVSVFGNILDKDCWVCLDEQRLVYFGSGKIIRW